MNKLKILKEFECNFVLGYIDKNNTEEKFIRHIPFGIIRDWLSGKLDQLDKPKLSKDKLKKVIENSQNKFGYNKYNAKNLEENNSLAKTIKEGDIYE